MARTRARTSFSASALPLLDCSAASRSAWAVASDSAILARAASAPVATAPATSACCARSRRLASAACAARAFPDRRRGQGVGPARDRPQPFLGRPDLKPGVGLGLPGRAGLSGQVVPVRGLRRVWRLPGLAGVGRAVLACLCLLEPGDEPGQRGGIALALPGDRGYRRLQPRGLLLRRPCRAGEAAKPPGRLRRSLVGGAHSGQCPAGGLTVPLLVGQRARQRSGRLLCGPFGRGQRGHRVLGRRAHRQHARRLGRAAVRPVRPEQVPVPGDHLQLGTGDDQVPRCGQVVGDHHPGQQPGQCRGEPSGRLHQVHRGHRARRKSPGCHASWQVRGRAAPRRRFSGSAAGPGAGVGDDQPGRSRVGALEAVQDRHGGIQASHRHRIGGTAERGRDGLLRALGHGQQGSDPAEDMPGPLGVRQQGRRGGGAVLYGPQALLQRLAAGNQGRAFGAGHPLGSAALGDAGGAFGERGGRLLVRGGQACPVVGPAGSRFLCLFVFPLGELGTGPGLLDGVRQAGRLLLAGRDAAAGGAHLAAQPGQLVGAGRGGAGLVGEQPFGRGQVRLRGRTAFGGLAKRGPGRLQRLAEDRLLLAQRGRLGVEFAGIPAGPGRGLVSG